MDFSVIIVSYNTADLIGDCLASAAASVECEKEIFVVDNASTDGTRRILAKYRSRIRLIKNEQNLGFAAAQNQAIRCSDAR